MFDNIEELTKAMNQQATDEVHPEDPDTEDEELDEEGEGEPLDDEEDDDEGEGIADEDDEGDEDDEQPETDSTDSAEKLIKWKTEAGEEFAVPLAELQKGYLRQSDYTRKAQDLSKERQTLQQTVQQKFGEVEQYAAELGAFHAQHSYVQQLEQAVSQMREEDDPIGYSSAVNKLLLARQRRDGLASQIAQVKNQRTFEQQQMIVERQKQAVEALTKGPDALPDFGPELVQAMNKTGLEYGFTDEELSTIVDPRHIRVLHDAMKYRELQSKKPQAVKKVRQAPARQKRTQKPSNVAKIAQQFDKAPSIEAMAALMSAAERKKR